MKLLVVHPDERSAHRLRQALAGHGHVVEVCPDPCKVEQLVAGGSHDLVLFKDAPPNHSAEQLLRSHREPFVARRLVFGCDAGPDQRARVLRAGADDYLVEPFVLAEALARIVALCRRQGRRIAFEHQMCLLDLELDLARRQAARHGRTLELTAQEFTLLAVFARHAGQVLSRAQLREHLWGEAVDSDSNLVEVAVRRLRLKLDRGMHPRLLHTVRGAGYVLARHSDAGRD
ncbi:MAG: response regulator transcription factor [Rubrivivax sp.]